MPWRVVRLNVLYALSVAMTLALMSSPVQTTTFVRRQLLRFGAAARVLSETTNTETPVIAAPAPATAAVTQARRTTPRSSGDQYRVPIGTVLPVRLRTPIDSRANAINDQVDAELTDPVTQNGVELIPAGSLLHGTIVEIEPATREAPRGRAAIVFAAIQHGDTGSRAAIRTRKLTIQAQAPPEPANARRGAKRQPVDLVLPAGYPVLLTLDEPLAVRIPSAPPPPRRSGLAAAD